MDELKMDANNGLGPRMSGSDEELITRHNEEVSDANKSGDGSAANVAATGNSDLLRNIGSGGGGAGNNFGVANSGSFVENNMKKIYQSLRKHETERLELFSSISSINQEISYLRHIIEFQNQKIEKFTNIISEALENKDQINLINSLQELQDNVDEQQKNGQNPVVDSSQAILVNDNEAPGNNGSNSGGPAGQTNPSLESNMDPALSEVAQAAVQAAAQAEVQQQFQNITRKKQQKRSSNKLSDEQQSGSSTFNSINESQNSGSNSQPRRVKKPKIVVEFLHNPMTVQEIYDEFTKGFKGQIPLKDMDEAYGKHEWRGDSRSKESKRFQRRKKLCDAIDRGVEKFNQPIEEIIRKIEHFRGDKSLTWIMNGHLPAELE